MRTNLTYSHNMGRTFRKDDDHNSASRKGRRQTSKRKPRNQQANFYDKSYNTKETFDEYYEEGFEKFTYEKRKNK